jgi:membrane protease YdiL (CAAX protease family)
MAEEIKMDNRSLSKFDKYMGWKTLAGYIILYAVAMVAYTIWAVGIRFVSLQIGIPQTISTTLNRLGGISISIGASALASTLILKHHFDTLALHRHPGWWRDFLFGSWLATSAMVALFAIFTGSGWLTIQNWRWQTVPFITWVGILWNSILINAYASVGEEVIFRGYLLSGLKEAWGKTVGLAVMSVIFAAMHLVVHTAKQTSIPLFILSLIGPGLLLGWAYLRTGSLWLPIGLHFMWNLVQDDLLNLPGRTELDSLFGLSTQLQGPSWLVGSAFGIETGLLSILPLGICIAGVWLWTLHQKPDQNIQNIGYAVKG